MNEWVVKDPHAAAPSGAPVLYCFHHAGGSAASYNAWRRNWSATSCLRFVELPGRPGAPQPLPFIQIDDLVAELLRGFLVQLDEGVPYAFYGHSLGALVAYRLTRGLVAQGHAAPAFLAVSGRRSPTCPLLATALWNLPEDALIDALRALGGLPESLLASAKWRRLFLPYMRADLRLSDEYLEAPDAPLPLTVIALRGRDDPIVSARELGNWCGVAGLGFEQDAVPGAHFFTLEGTRHLQHSLQDAMERLIGIPRLQPRLGSRYA
jgi:medium-chain acyl-[acyl-carrier-protein] hydrolase